MFLEKDFEVKEPQSIYSSRRRSLQLRVFLNYASRAAGAVMNNIGRDNRTRASVGGNTACSFLLWISSSQKWCGLSIFSPAPLTDSHLISRIQRDSCMLVAGTQALAGRHQGCMLGCRCRVGSNHAQCVSGIFAEFISTSNSTSQAPSHM